MCKGGTWSTLVQVMTWCLYAPSHYLNLCWLIVWRDHVDLTWKQFNSSPPSATYTAMNRASIGSCYDLSPVRSQAIIWTNADLLSIAPLGINSNEILIKVANFSFMKMPSAKCQPFWPWGDQLKGKHSLCQLLNNAYINRHHHFYSKKTFNIFIDTI